MPRKVREVVQPVGGPWLGHLRSKGSHRQFKHPDKPYVISVPGRDGKELAPGTPNALLWKAGLK